MTTEPSAPQDLTALEADIARHRTSLAASVDELTTRLNPRELARTAATDARRGLLGTPGPDGGARPERLIAIAGAAVTVLVVLTLLRRAFRRRAGVRP